MRLALLIMRERERVRSISEASVPHCFSDFDAYKRSKNIKIKKNYLERCARQVYALCQYLDSAAFGFLFTVSAHTFIHEVFRDETQVGFL